MAKTNKVTNSAIFIKYVGDKPINNALVAKIPTSITGDKIAFPHRYMKDIDTGVSIVEIESGYKLCFSLSKALSDRGMIITNGPGNLKEGSIIVTVLNCGREIVEIKNGDKLLDVWIERDLVIEWLPKDN